MDKESREERFLQKKVVFSGVFACKSRQTGEARGACVGPGVMLE